MVTVIDKSISIDEAVQLIEKSNAAHVYITGKKFDAPVKYENQTPQSTVEMIKETFDTHTYFRHRMTGTYLVERNDSGQLLHKINLYFQSNESGENFIEFEIKYTPVAVNDYDIFLDDNPASPTVPYVHQSERIFWDEYHALPRKMEKAPNSIIQRPPAKKKGTLYFLKALYNYVIGKYDAV